MGTKICKECLVELPLSSFTIMRANKDGLQSRCKPCDNARQMANINGKKEAYTASRLAYRQANADKYRAYRRRAKAVAKAKDPEFATRQWRVRRAKDPRTFWAKAVMAQVRVRCKKKDLACDITHDYILSITPDACPVFGMPFVFTGGRGGFQPDSASVDRIRPELGYVRGNVIVVSWRANMIKGDATVKELKAVTHFYHRVEHGLTDTPRSRQPQPSPPRLVSAA